MNNITEIPEGPKDTFNRSRFYPLPRDLCFPMEKPLFISCAVGKKNLVEIGVFEGASAALFRRVMAKTATLHLIDPFIPDSMSTHLQARKWITKLNVARVRNGKIRWYEDYSYNVSKSWKDSIDFLFIDGDHVEEHCRRDWEEWSHFIEPGGIVIFHDARFGMSKGKFWDGWPGPTNVVTQLFRGPGQLKNWEIVEEAGTAVAVVRRN